MWTAILDGALADTAREAVRAIAEDLARGPVAQSHPAEVALFWAYAAGALDDPRADDAYADAVAALVAQVDQLTAPHLYGGLAGAGFVLAHVGDNGGELLDAVDCRLAEIAAAWDGHYDLIGGLTGFGVYFLERLADPTAIHARAGLASVAAALVARADADGAWPTSLRWLTDAQRAVMTDGDRDCGVPHGNPGALALLGRIAALEAPPVDVRATIRACARWLRAQQLPPHPAGRYPYSIADATRARTAWCYGDPGVAITAWSAAARTGDDTAPWRELAIAAATRPVELCGIRDAGLCHGALGLAHIYNRCYQASRDPQLAAGARAWFERGLAMRTSRGIGGFLAPRDDSPPDAPLYESSDELLSGATGIGLALLAATSDQEPGWDRLLMCDLPPHE